MFRYQRARTLQHFLPKASMLVLFLLASVLLLCGVASLRAESSADALRAALKAAVDKASLESAGSPPFRLEAKYETFDYKGEPQAAGTLTEEFLRPGLHKLTVHEGSSGDVYAPEDQARIGEPAPASSGNFMERLLVEMLLHPGPVQTDLEGAPLKEKDQKLGEMTLRCITLQLTGKTPRGSLRFPQIFCLSQSEPLLRVAVQRYNLQAVYNKLQNFAGHTVAEDITLRQGTKVRGRLQVTRLVTAPALKEGDFPNESNDRIEADRLVGGAKIGSAVMAGRELSKVAPVYPVEAKQKHLTGAVVLRAIIGKDGAIEDLEVMSGPVELAESAMNAVSQWRYEPYLLNGKPTEVDTTVTVRYDMR